jgi:hypothetical protein
MDLLKENYHLKKELYNVNEKNNILNLETKKRFDQIKFLESNYCHLIKEFNNKKMYIWNLKREYKKISRKIHQEKDISKIPDYKEKAKINILLQGYSIVRFN